MKRFLIIGAILGLIGTVTNKIFISPLPSLIAAALFPFILLANRKFPITVFWLLVFFVYSLVSTFLYYPQSFLEFGFYRYDGNFIVSYLPLLVLPFFRLNVNIDKIFRNFLLITTGISCIVFLINGYNYDKVFTGLFIATNAAGGFYSIVTSLAIIYFLEKKTYNNLYLVLFNAFFLYSSTSRGSILGLLLGLLCLYFVKRNKTYYITFSLIVLSAIQIYILIGSFPEYKKYIMNSPNADMFYNLDMYVVKKYGYVSTKFKNVLIRMYETWPRAIDCFFKSPIFGTGFGSINDVPFKFKQVLPIVLTTNSQENKLFSDSHAHHSFLHFLGELGVLGLTIFLLFWRSVYKFLLNNNYNNKVQSFLLVSFFNLTIMSFTEHRITTPSNALPFVIALSLYYVFVNYQKSLEVKNINS